MIASPLGAPPRPDLDWLRHRTRRAPLSAPPTSSHAGDGPTALADFLAGRTTRRHPQAASTPSQQVTPAAQPAPASPAVSRVDEIDLSGNPLDLSAPAPTGPLVPAPAPAPRAPTASPANLDLSGDPLDLSGDLDLPGPPQRPSTAPATPDLPAPGPQPADTPRPAPASDLDLSGGLDRSGGLDLSAPPPLPPAPPPTPSADLDLFPEPASGPTAVPAPAPRPAPVVRATPRVSPGGRVILTSREPTVTLDRLQSGIGGLTLTAVCSPAVGDLVLGAVYQLSDGTSGVLGAATGISTAPPRSRRPVLQGGRDEFERITVDLRQSRSLRRFVVWATSASERELVWGGTLRLATHGGARVEIPLDVGRHVGPLVIASVYAVDGEFVLRAELDPVAGVARDVARAYGFGAITWADARTPVL
ncbi:hypothetical protein [Klenkia sp. PcliD-1-E]|uniref:hypothetical protein n=1 Tax=Klenkia sp. PcliD-1-E TaxID=2954492 RepID=UPI00209766DB|nr:hypothetical protein [Klenkia sp. PcliD-1-E]MCO7219375.1 hypothetical protein [Klenkia sp. PcliD-1-E]